MVLGELRAAGAGDFRASEARPVERRATTFLVDDRRNPADLYLAEGAPRAALILVPGAAPAGKDDPRLVAVAEALARARFRVLVPDLERMRSLRITSEDAHVLKAAAQHLAAEVPHQPLGVIAISFAVGPAVLAIQAGAPVDFLVAFGGYWDLQATLTFATTGAFREGPGQPWRYREPNPYGRWVFVLSNVDRLTNARDRSLLRRIAELRLDDPAADTQRLEAALGREGQAVQALLTNADPDRVPKLVAALPPAVRAEIRALNLATVAGDSWNGGMEGVDVVLIHGIGDPVIPETESMAFARAVGPFRSRLYLVDGLRHVEPDGLGIAGAKTLLEAAHRVLTLRDAKVGRDHRSTDDRG